MPMQRFTFEIKITKFQANNECVRAMKNKICEKHFQTFSTILAVIKVINSLTLSNIKMPANGPS